MNKSFSSQRLISLLPIVAAVLPLSLLFAGCSGGGSSSFNPNPTPTSTPTSNNYKLTGNLVFSNISLGSTAVTTTLTSFNTSGEAGDLYNTTYPGGITQTVLLGSKSGPIAGVTRSLALDLDSNTDPFVNPKLFTVGQSITLNNSNQYVQLTEVEGNSAESWRTTSGAAIVRAIGTNSITVELKNARFAPTNMFGGVGTFTINGTLTGTGLRVVNTTLQ